MQPKEMAYMYCVRRIGVEFCKELRAGQEYINKKGDGDDRTDAINYFFVKINDIDGFEIFKDQNHKGRARCKSGYEKPRGNQTTVPKRSATKSLEKKGSYGMDGWCPDNGKEHDGNIEIFFWFFALKTFIKNVETDPQIEDQVAVEDNNVPGEE